jgi:hypothetical protein
MALKATKALRRTGSSLRRSIAGCRIDEARRGEFVGDQEFGDSSSQRPPDGGEYVTGMEPFLLACRGLSRPFQNLKISQSTVLENAIVGSHLQERGSVLADLLNLPSTRDQLPRRKLFNLGLPLGGPMERYEFRHVCPNPHGEGRASWKCFQLARGGRENRSGLSF